MYIDKYTVVPHPAEYHDDSQVDKGARDVGDLLSAASSARVGRQRSVNQQLIDNHSHHEHQH